MPVTVAPYMWKKTSVKPFLAYDGKWVVFLALTSPIKGCIDFQYMLIIKEKDFSKK